MKNYIVYDLETFGKNIYYDRIAQFAGLRLNENFEIIPNSQLVLYCRLPLDYLPTRDSILITGITPQEVQEKGLPEPEFAKRLYDYFS